MRLKMPAMLGNGGGGRRGSLAQLALPFLAQAVVRCGSSARELAKRRTRLEKGGLQLQGSQS